MPLLWPAPNCWWELEFVEDIVLVRLGGNGFEESEYVEEFVEAFEAFEAVYRKGLDLLG